MQGHDLAALIFAREISDQSTGLVKSIDKQLGESSARHRGPNKLGVHVVFCSDEAGLDKKLQDLVAKEGLKHVVLSVSINKSAGPPRYNIAREAELTVVIYKDRTQVLDNVVLDSVDLTSDKTKEIMKSLKRVLP